jgi:hypothetical protein
MTDLQETRKLTSKDIALLGESICFPDLQLDEFSEIFLQKKSRGCHRRQLLGQ